MMLTEKKIHPRNLMLPDHNSKFWLYLPTHQNQIVVTVEPVHIIFSLSICHFKKTTYFAIGNNNCIKKKVWVIKKIIAPLISLLIKLHSSVLHQLATYINQNSREHTQCTECIWNISLRSKHHIKLIGEINNSIKIICK